MRIRSDDCLRRNYAKCNGSYRMLWTEMNCWNGSSDCRRPQGTLVSGEVSKATKTFLAVLKEGERKAEIDRLMALAEAHAQDKHKLECMFVLKCFLHRYLFTYGLEVKFPVPLASCEFVGEGASQLTSQGPWFRPWPVPSGPWPQPPRNQCMGSAHGSQPS